MYKRRILLFKQAGKGRS